MWGSSGRSGAGPDGFVGVSPLCYDMFRHTLMNYYCYFTGLPTPVLCINSIVLSISY